MYKAKKPFSKSRRVFDEAFGYNPRYTQAKPKPKPKPKPKKNTKKKKK